MDVLVGQMPCQNINIPNNKPKLKWVLFQLRRSLLGLLALTVAAVRLQTQQHPTKPPVLGGGIAGRQGIGQHFLACNAPADFRYIKCLWLFSIK